MRRVLFVDDDPSVLNGLRRVLRKMRGEWQTLFATSGQEALITMQECPVDVVVTDMQMPKMDGAQLLTQVAKLYPHTARIILSGHSELEMVLKSATTAHQYLAKPCDINALKASIDRILKLQKLLNNEELENMASKLNTLPSMSSVYQELNELMFSPSSTMEQVGEVIAKDIGLSAKILQLVNSAFFGLKREISSPAEASSFLGMDVIRGLVCNVTVFDMLDESLGEGFNLETISEKGLYTGIAAKAIAKHEKQSAIVCDHAFIAGLMHDVGKLVLAVNKPEEYRKVLKIMAAKGKADFIVEQHVFGQSHMAIGAYLLGLWGMHNNVVEAVAFHHRPDLCANSGFLPLTALYGALALDERLKRAEVKQYPLAALEKMGIDKDKMRQWGAVLKSL